jgi:hypothetical protein
LFSFFLGNSSGKLFEWEERGSSLMIFSDPFFVHRVTWQRESRFRLGVSFLEKTGWKLILLLQIVAHRGSEEEQLEKPRFASILFLWSSIVSIFK